MWNFFASITTESFKIHMGKELRKKTNDDTEKSWNKKKVVEKSAIEWNIYIYIFVLTIELFLAHLKQNIGFKFSKQT